MKSWTRDELHEKLENLIHVLGGRIDDEAFCRVTTWDAGGGQYQLGAALAHLLGGPSPDAIGDVRLDRKQWASLKTLARRLGTDVVDALDCLLTAAFADVQARQRWL